MKRISMAGLIATMLFTAGNAFAQQPLNSTAFMHSPESVATDGNSFYIADLGPGGEPTKKDGNGVIFKMDQQGHSTVFAKGLDAPKGAFIWHHQLFVADVDKVKGYDMTSGALLYNIDVAPTTSFLNDIVAINDSTLVASATDVNKLFLIHLGHHPRAEELLYTTPIRGTNGVVYDSQRKRLYVCGFGDAGKPDGQIGFIDMAAAKKVFTPLTDRLGYYDGIALTQHNSKLIISDWVAFEKKGVLLELDLSNAKITTLNQVLIAGPADFTLDHKGDVITPAMMEGNILKYRVAK
ncbi:hypothetical protein [Chitinophaga sp.]|uniref:hypothetical protein n=1 Tax=Chitinophaga sp. TaxID=1869181 RepID=UPI002F956C4E